MNKKEKFIEKSNKFHNNKYDYSLVEYKDSQTKIKIICPEHGIFEQIPANHSNRYGCPSCGGTKTHNVKSFVEKAKNIHSNYYDYSLVKYVNNKTNVKIICPKHGIFEQRPDNHLNGQRCGECFGTHLKEQDIFIQEVKNIHNNKYDYSLVEYKNAHKKIKVICPEHGIFDIKPIHHLNEVGCPSCTLNSKGESKIEIYLNMYGFSYEKEKTFKECKVKRCLRFDFYLPNNNLCIEYDGKQHYESFYYFGGEKALLETQKRDEIKNVYCKDNNIKLLRIPYWEYDNIEKILKENIQ